MYHKLNEKNKGVYSIQIYYSFSPETNNSSSTSLNLFSDDIDTFHNLAKTFKLDAYTISKEDVHEPVFKSPLIIKLEKEAAEYTQKVKDRLITGVNRLNELPSKYEFDFETFVYTITVAKFSEKDAMRYNFKPYYNMRGSIKFKNGTYNDLNDFSITQFISENKKFLYKSFLNWNIWGQHLCSKEQFTEMCKEYCNVQSILKNTFYE